MKKILFLVWAFLTVDSKAQIITTVAGNGTAGFGGDGNPAINAFLNNPDGIAVDAAGNVYSTDYFNNRVRKISTSGIISTIAGTGSATFGGDGSAATSADLNGPSAVCLDAAGNIYIADYNNNRIRKINTSGIISTIAGNGSASFSGDGGQAVNASFNGPTGVVLDASGNLYVADEFNQRIRKINTSGVISTFAGNGNTSFGGDGGLAVNASFNAPRGIAIDALGNIYVADELNQRIRIINTSGIISTFAGNGVQGSAGDGSAATSGSLNRPAGVGVDPAGSVFVPEYGGNRLRIIRSNGIINTYAGNGTAGFSGDGGPATSAQLQGPTGIGLDAAGNIYIADAINNRVRKVTADVGINPIVGSHNVVTIYPNPASGNVIIDTKNISLNMNCIMYDISGKIVLSQPVSSNAIIDLSDLSEGIYNVSLISVQGILNKKLVIIK